MFTGYVFTLTAGRTGTAWLAQFLALNLGVQAIHEPLGIDDFGENMPDIRTMRSFNDRGNDDVVTAFWARKLGAIGRQPHYIETNHTLAKCGLIENIVDTPVGDKATLIVLTRDKVACCASYLLRGDFSNITLQWEWYLTPGYRNNIIAFQPFMALGALGVPTWYVQEMEARQIYYQRLFGERLRFRRIDLAELTALSGAAALLGELGHAGPIRLPAPANINPRKADPRLLDRLREIFAAAPVDPAAAVDAYIASGRRLSDRFAPVPPVPSGVSMKLMHGQLVRCP